MIDNRVALITGASSGIGRAAALAFAGQGTHVVATARRTTRLEELVEASARLPGDILPITADVTHAAAMEQAVETTIQHWGRLDILVANAGLGQRGALVEADWQDLDTVIQTNITGVLHSVRAAVPAMRQAGNGGHILLVSSIAGIAPAPYAAIYGASKAFVNGLARGLRYELAEDNIRVTTFLVGQTHSEFAETRLGRPGRVASKVPTMTAEQVAGHLVRTVGKNRRSVVLRLFDTAFIIGATLAPGLMDRVLYRIYK